MRTKRINVRKHFLTKTTQNGMRINAVGKQRSQSLARREKIRRSNHFHYLNIKAWYKLKIATYMYLYNGCVLSHLYVVFSRMTKGEREFNVGNATTFQKTRESLIYISASHYTITCILVIIITLLHVQ